MVNITKGHVVECLQVALKVCFLASFVLQEPFFPCHNPLNTCPIHAIPHHIPKVLRGISPASFASYEVRVMRLVAIGTHLVSTVNYWATAYMVCCSLWLGVLFIVIHLITGTWCTIGVSDPTGGSMVGLAGAEAPAFRLPAPWGGGVVWFVLPKMKGCRPFRGNCMCVHIGTHRPCLPRLD